MLNDLQKPHFHNGCAILIPSKACYWISLIQYSTALIEWRTLNLVYIAPETVVWFNQTWLYPSLVDKIHKWYLPVKVINGVTLKFLKRCSLLILLYILRPHTMENLWYVENKQNTLKAIPNQLIFAQHQNTL